MATKQKAKAGPSPVNVQVIPSGKPAEGALIDVKTGLTENKKYLITVRPAKGRPVLIAVHL